MLQRRDVEPYNSMHYRYVFRRVAGEACDNIQSRTIPGASCKKTVTMVRRLTLVLFLIALCADAHAILKSSVPRPKEVVAGPDVAITLTFNSRIDVKRSQIAVVGQGNSERKLSLGNQPSPDVVATVAKGLQNGHYVVRWQVLASDGHISRGEIPFEVR